LLARQNFIDQRIPQLITQIASDGQQMVAILSADPDLSVAADRTRFNVVGADMKAASAEEASLKDEGFKNEVRINQLKTTVPASLQGELQGCAQAVAPLDQLVNFYIQSIAILTTSGAAEIILPKRTLYVDMGEVLHGKPLGGDDSAVIKARNDAENAVGIHGDAKKVIDNPIQGLGNALQGKGC
jgi:hypothetical protein